MENYGLKLRRFKDHRRYDFHRTFGGAPALTDCEFDLSLSDFNQNLPNPVTGDPALPNGCTGFTRADIASNEDHILYKPGFTYRKTCLIEGVAVGEPCSLESSFKSGVVYGLQAVGEDTDAQALPHRRGPYFEVTRGNGDWFDSLWSALLKGNRSLSAGTAWYPEMTAASVVDSVQARPTADGHNWEITGVTTANGVPRMHVKWWGGEPKWFGRAAVNSLMGAQGSDCLTDVDGKATPADIRTVRLSIIEVLISYYQRLIALLQERPAGAPPFIPNIPAPMPEDTATAPKYLWDNPNDARHSVRVICDEEGLSWDMKNDLSACVDVESGFMNYQPDGTPTEFQNLDKVGRVWSTDWGICQVNDWFHIGEGKDFPSVDYVMQNPDACVRWMAKQFLAGNAHLWSSYASGAYKKYL